MSAPKLTAERRKQIAEIDRETATLDGQIGPLAHRRGNTETMRAAIAATVEQWVVKVEEHAQGAAEVLVMGGKPDHLLPSDPGALAVLLIGAEATRKLLANQIAGHERFLQLPSVTHLQALEDRRRFLSDRRYEVLKVAELEQAAADAKEWRRLQFGDHAE